VVIELGADFNQGRYVDRQTFALHQQRKRDEMLCEVVFMLNIDLVEQNWVKVGKGAGDRAIVSMKPSPTPAPVRAALNKIQRQIIDALGGGKIDSTMTDDAFVLHEAKLGAAGHETGTLRLKRRQAGGQDGAEPGWVVDDDLKLRDYQNLYVCDLSIFPVSPAANPSLTLAALAMRLAEHLATAAKG
jgi:choline dehydrogenase-like flavoprotein